MFLHVTDVEVSDGYTLSLRFNNGESRTVDLEPELYGEVFEPLRDKSFFAHARVNEETGTVEWPNGADFAPEFLYEAGEQSTAVRAGSTVVK
jgi:hypothetical protein